MTTTTIDHAVGQAAAMLGATTRRPTRGPAATAGADDEAPRAAPVRVARAKEAPRKVQAAAFAVFALLVTLMLRLADRYEAAIASFAYKRGEGLHHPLLPVAGTLLYLGLLAAVPRLMKDRAPMKGGAFSHALAMHNMALSGFSLVALGKIVEQLVAVAAMPDGSWLENLTCDESCRHPRTGTLYFWYHVFYLSKYYEYMDTVFLMLRKHEVIFLHSYHHVITLWLTWFMMDLSAPPQWGCIAMNLLVHTVMYYYYAMQALGYSVWWKKLLTSLQILQFVVDMAVNFTWPYYKLVRHKDCCSHWPVFFGGMFVISSFLVLFIHFYAKTYGPRTPSPRGEQQQRQQRP